MRGRIWIGALLPAGDLDVPGLLARFSHAHPGVEVELREGIAADMLRFSPRTSSPQPSACWPATSRTGWPPSD
jgi:hypothetical protein